MSKLNLSAQQKNDLKRCFNACNELFYSDAWNNTYVDNLGFNHNNIPCANLCHRAVNMIYIKAMDMHLIPNFIGESYTYLGFQNKYISETYEDIPFFRELMRTSFTFYGWELPVSFNFSQCDCSQQTDLDSTLVAYIESNYSSYFGYKMKDVEFNKEDFLREFLETYDITCFYHPKWSTIEIHKLSHPDVTEDKNYMSIYNHLHELIQSFTSFNNEFETNVCIVNNCFYSFSIHYHEEDEFYDMFAQSPVLNTHPGYVFLLDELDEVMEQLLSYINRAAVS